VAAIVSSCLDVTARKYHPKRDGLMQIQVNTDDNIEGRDELIAQVEADIRDGLSRFADRITRVEVQAHNPASCACDIRD